MNTKKYPIIFFLSVIILFWAYGVSQKVVSNPKNTEKNILLLMPYLGKSTEEIGTIIIRSKGKTFKVHNENGQWVIPDKYSYPVAIEKIRDLVANSARVQILEKKTSSASNLASLGLDDSESESSSAIRIIFLSGDEKTTYADYIRGVNRKGVSGGTQHNEIYARLTNSNQAYLVHADLNFDLGAHSILGGETFAIKYENLNSISFNYPKNTIDNFTIGKNLPGQLDFEILEPKDRKLKAFAKANAISTSLEYMELEDIMDKETFPEKEPEVIITYKTFKGLTMVVNLFKHENENWLTFTASADEKDTKSTDEAARINKLAERWVYKVNFKSTGGFYYKLEDMVKE